MAEDIYKLHNFLPIYPEFYKDVKDILGERYIEQGDPNFNIYRKKEFYDYRLDKQEFKPEKPGDQMKHQVIIARFLSSNTPYKGLLLMHEPGTGKTCSSVGAIEQIKEETSDYDGALILMKGTNLINNYINELAFICTCKEQDKNRKCISGPYIPESYHEEDITDEQRKRRVNAEIKKFYEFDTFGVFSKRISKMKKELQIKKYSNKIIVIDETHNLRISDEDEKQYNIIHEFLHTVQNSKIILLTGTPMVDKPEEIASILNLILPIDKQLPVQDDFVKEYLNRDEDNKNISVLDPSKKNIFKKNIHGYVSYLKAMKSDVKKTYVGDINIGSFKLYSLRMGKFQSDVYEPVYIRDKESSEKRGVYNDSIQSSLFVFPDESYGSEGFAKYVEVKRVKSRLKDTERSVYVLKEALKDSIIKGAPTNEQRLERLRKYSVIYADCIEKLLDPSDKTNHFIYVKLVKGSGAILFARLLDLFGFKESKGGFSKGLHYSIITNETTTDKENLEILKTFNSPSNVDGKYIKVIIGSKVISEGITFKNIQNIHIFTPSWNFSETDQATARGYRLFSHSDLERAGIDVNVNIFLYCALPEDGNPNNSIDYQMYKVSQDKDISIKSIERAVKEASIDCALNKNRNSFKSSMNNTRECEYEDCQYVCDGVPEDYIDNVPEEEIDKSTYDLYYNSKDINRIIENIQGIFDTHNINYISLSNLLFILSTKTDVSYPLLLNSIIKMVSNNITKNDVLGNKCFYRFDNDTLYLTYNLKNNTNFFDTYYVENFPLQSDFNLNIFNSKIETLFQDNLPNLFNKMKDEKDISKKREMLRKFPLLTQEFFLETAILSSEKQEGNEKFRKFLLDEFNPFIIRRDDIVISTLLDKLRCLDIKDDLDDLEWRECSEDEEKNIREQMAQKKEERRENPYGYYGIIDKTKNKFLIADMSTEKEKVRITKTGKVDARRARKGKACDPSWKHKDLLILIDKIKLPFPEKFANKQSKRSDDDLSREHKKHKEIGLAFTEDVFKDMPRDDKLRVIYWGSSGKDSIPKSEICKAIQKWFKEHNLLEEYIK